LKIAVSLEPAEGLAAEKQACSHDRSLDGQATGPGGHVGLKSVHASMDFGWGWARGLRRYTAITPLLFDGGAGCSLGCPAPV
jgi:hypothetical protein